MTKKTVQFSGVRAMEWRVVQRWLWENNLRNSDAINVLALLILRPAAWQDALNQISPYWRALNEQEIREEVKRND